MLHTILATGSKNDCKQEGDGFGSPRACALSSTPCRSPNKISNP